MCGNANILMEEQWIYASISLLSELHLDGSFCLHGMSWFIFIHI